jgi:HAD superfamily phosphoserine phosphatase-like hydrolase
VIGNQGMGFSSSPVVYFDFDDTLIPGDSILYWKRYFFIRKPYQRYFQIITWVCLIAYFLRLCGPEALKRIFLLPVSWLTPKEIDSFSQDFVRDELIPRLYPEMIKKLKEHQKQGFRVVIISASPLFYLRFLEDYLPDVRVIGTTIRFPSTGLCRWPRFDSKWGNMKGETKVDFLKSDPQESDSGIGCYAYSDSHSDAPLLNFVQHAVAVQPNCKLETMAKKRGWQILKPRVNSPRWRRNLMKVWLLLSDLGTWPQ